MHAHPLLCLSPAHVSLSLGLSPSVSHSLYCSQTVDEVAVPERVREELYKLFPEARQAQIKTGGNFPYLSRADEVNLHLQVGGRGRRVRNRGREGQQERQRGRVEVAA